jgi:hypothetical protein
MLRDPMRYLFAAVGLVALAGCAGLGAADCGPDWYAVGQRDGILGAQPQEEIYAGRCGAVDAARYREGWQDGISRRPRPTA